MHRRKLHLYSITSGANSVDRAARSSFDQNRAGLGRQCTSGWKDKSTGAVSEMPMDPI
jgi:hypothetical protein